VTNLKARRIQWSCAVSERERTEEEALDFSGNMRGIDFSIFRLTWRKLKVLFESMSAVFLNSIQLT